MSAAPELPDSSPAECRCFCGSLLARLTSEGVELKCRRCKRTLLVPLETAGGPRASAPIPAPVVREAR